MRLKPSVIVARLIGKLGSAVHSKRRGLAGFDAKASSAPATSVYPPDSEPPPRCPCKSWLYCDTIYQTMCEDQKEEWETAVNRTGLTGYNLWMMECMAQVNQYQAPPDHPSPSGGFCTRETTEGTKWPCLEDPIIGMGPEPPPTACTFYDDFDYDEDPLHTNWEQFKGQDPRWHLWGSMDDNAKLGIHSEGEAQTFCMHHTPLCDQNQLVWAHITNTPTGDFWYYNLFLRAANYDNIIWSEYGKYLGNYFLQIISRWQGNGYGLGYKYMPVTDASYIEMYAIDGWITVFVSGPSGTDSFSTYYTRNMEHRGAGFGARTHPASENGHFMEYAQVYGTDIII